MLFYFHHLKDHDPISPDDQAHAANEGAKAATHAKIALEERKKSIWHQLDRPSVRKLLSASLQLVAFCFLMGICWMLVGIWEYIISVPIYEVMILKGYPWIPFLGCMAVAIYCSVCLAESTDLFSLYADDTIHNPHERVRSKLYSGNRVKRLISANWFLSPLTGMVVAIVFMAFLYYLSEARVIYMKEAGETVDKSLLAICLPVVLYGVEILLGIPAYYGFMWGLWKIRIARYKRVLSRATAETQKLETFALKERVNYESEHANYNFWAYKNGKNQRGMIPANAALRDIIEKEWGNDGPLSIKAAMPSKDPGGQAALPSTIDGADKKNGVNPLDD